MVDVHLTPDAKRDPAGVWSRAVAFRQTLGQQLIAKGARKRYFHGAVVMHVSDFRPPQAENASTEAVRPRRNSRPLASMTFELLQVRDHRSKHSPSNPKDKVISSLPSSMLESTWRLRISERILL